MLNQVRIVRSIVGFFNLYLVDHAEQPRVTVSPEKFAELFPSFSPKLRFGCGEISQVQAIELFGETLKEVNVA
jgi:hypothetical protein